MLDSWGPVVGLACFVILFVLAIVWLIYQGILDRNIRKQRTAEYLLSPPPPGFRKLKDVDQLVNVMRRNFPKTYRHIKSKHFENVCHKRSADHDVWCFDFLADHCEGSQWITMVAVQGDQSRFRTVVINCCHGSVSSSPYDSRTVVCGKGITGEQPPLGLWWADGRIPGADWVRASSTVAQWLEKSVPWEGSSLATTHVQLSSSLMLFSRHWLLLPLNEVAQFAGAAEQFGEIAREEYSETIFESD